MASGQLEHFVKISKVINGGTNGLEDRIKKFKAGVTYFKTL